MSRAKRIGIIGGTFNPIHYAHLIIADRALHQYDLDQVIFLPTGHSPHKSFMGEEMTEHRCRMTELAIAGNDGFSIDYYEVENPDINYTYLTLEAFHQRDPEAELFFIIGGDSLAEFGKWRYVDRICEQASILVAVRDDVDEEDLAERFAVLEGLYGKRFYRIDTPNYSISSKNIRTRISEGSTIRYMVPDAVLDYIMEHQLYKIDVPVEEWPGLDQDQNAGDSADLAAGSESAGSQEQ